MNVLIKQANIISTTSAYNGKIKDILIENGIIKKISNSIEVATDTIINQPNTFVSIGWIDIFADFGSPGFEQNETFESGAKVAASGGFTNVMLIPNTRPASCGRSQIDYLISKKLNINIHPIGAVSKNIEGKELTEMYDMHSGGAVAFSDGTSSIQNTGLMLKALQYLIPINSTLIQIPDDNSISPKGVMNEGIISTKIGLPAKPALSEELMIHRDIELLKYTNSKLHITGVSTKKGLQIIKKAKDEGFNITCSATPYHCYFCDEDLENYNVDLKLNPPLRTRQDMLAIKQGLIDGTIDCIASHHLPVHADEKEKEFEYAKNGMAAMQVIYSVLNTFISDQNRIVELLTNGRKIFGIPEPLIEEGKPACLTIFNSTESYIFTSEKNHSLSKNNAFTNIELKGRVIGIQNFSFTFINS
ncbi:MAG: dihydroorotase [Ferruginibacter sp.]